MGRAVLAVLADGARRPADAGAVDRTPQGSERPRGVERRDDLVGVRDVTVRVLATDLLGESGAALVVEVGEHHLHPARGQETGRRLAEAGRAARDDR